MSFLASWVTWNGTQPPVDRENMDVRTTVEPVRDDKVATVDTDYNAVSLDSSPELKGLSRTAPAADNTPSRQSTPIIGNADWTSIIDNQVASSGMAPAQEASGRWGHGSMQYDESIEPVIRPGGKLGGDYFLSNGAPVQDGASDYMSTGPSGVQTVQDNMWAATAQRSGTVNARKANGDSLYAVLVRQ